MGLKEEYQEKIEGRLREWAAKMNELKAKAEEAKADVKIKMEERLDAMRPKLEAAQAKFQELRQAGSEKWDNLRVVLDQDIDDLKKTWESTREQRDAYQEGIEAQLKEWSQRLNELTAKAQQASVEVKDKMMQEIEELRSRKDELQQSLLEIKTAGTEKWEQLKASAEKGKADLKKTWESLKARYF